MCILKVLFSKVLCVVLISFIFSSSVDSLSSNAPSNNRKKNLKSKFDQAARKKNNEKPFRRYGRNNARHGERGYENRISGVRTKRKRPPRWEVEGDSLFFLVGGDDEKVISRDGITASFLSNCTSPKELLDHAFPICSSKSSDGKSGEIIIEEHKSKDVKKEEKKNNKGPPNMMMWGKCSVGPILRKQLIDSGLDQPTPIQEEAFAILSKGTTKKHDVPNNAVIASPTGSGKTLAFLLPLLSTRQRYNNMANIMIVSPSVDLALQIQKEVDKLWPKDCDHSAMYIAQMHTTSTSEYSSEEKCLEEIRERKPPIIAGTSRSLNQLLSYCIETQDRRYKNNFQLFSNLQTLVVDEADRLLQTEAAARSSASSSSSPLSKKESKNRKFQRNNFFDKSKKASPIEELVDKLETMKFTLNYFHQSYSHLKRLQLICASATVGRTLRRQIMEITNAPSIDKGATLISADDRTGKDEEKRKSSLLPSTICHAFSVFELTDENNAINKSEDKKDTAMIQFALWETIKVLPPAPSIIFPGKVGVQCMVDYLKTHHELTGVKTLRDNIIQESSNTNTNLESWKDCPIYVMNEKFSRGLDIPNVQYVFLASPPNSPAAYAHLAGRTGRQGNEGTCISIVKDMKEARRIISLSNTLGVKFCSMNQSGNNISSSNNELNESGMKINPQQMTEETSEEIQKQTNKLSYESMTVAMLKEVLKERKLKVSGKKAELVERLILSD